MPKAVTNIFNSKISFINLLSAHHRALKGKISRNEVSYFNMFIEIELHNLLYKIKSGNYNIGKYRTFTIYEPKERLIKALPYKDRVVHQWYVEEIIKPYFCPKFVSDSYACIEEKGTHRCVEKTQKYMKKVSDNAYVLKCDIKKYFYNINKEILFNIIKRTIKDKKVLELTKLFIYDNSEPFGIPIGNYTSQYYANIYLNELDHFIKEKLKVKYYTRYMDDFILILPTKEECKAALIEITQFLKDKLHLELNQKTRYFPITQGIDYCGYKIFKTHKLIRKRSIINVKRKIKKGITKESWNSWRAHCEHADTYNLIKKLSKDIKFIDDKK